jgi:RNA polymerase sigma-70 factor (ECF subfamily)
VHEAGDAALFSRIALPHLDAAYNLARWLVRDPAAAEDVVQDAMVRALNYFASFRGENPRAWLLSIVRNVALTLLDRGARSREQPLDAEPGGAHEHLADAAPDPESALARTEQMSQLEHMLSTLPPDLRECVVLRELEEMSYRDIARITGVPVGTVMSRLFRGRQALMRFGQAAGAGETAA